MFKNVSVGEDNILYKDGVQNAQTSLSGHTPSTADPSYTLWAGRNTRERGRR